MKRSITIYLTSSIIFLSLTLTNAQSPVSKFGRLKLVGKQLSSECGKPVQLRGMSSHGIQWFKNCLTGPSLGILINDWNIDVLRMAMYVDEGGYLTDTTYFKNTINTYVNYCDKNGVYCIIDWHVLTPGDPNAHIKESKGFWNYMSAMHSAKKNVIYEICNEPNGVSWSTVKNYANTIIPIIRANDKEAIILVGTPNYSSDLDSPANDPITGANAYNVMYTYHFYAASHMSRLGGFSNNTNRIPIFVSEWGTSDFTGGGNIDLNGAQQWMDNFNGANAGGVKISWTNWNFSDAKETSAALATGSCANKDFTTLTPSGTKVKYWISNPAKSSVACIFPNGIEDDSHNQLFTNIYPNPFNDNFTVNLGPNFKDVLKVEVTDQEGKILETYNTNNVLPELHFGSKLSNGQYFVRIIRSNKVEIKSVVKLK
ncbi:MAG: cellulase family glycosylhydrolase [Opitutaceae bacterium]|nr:cellulase family glycosylhydrolase [Cytophagales bacterium]